MSCLSGVASAKTEALAAEVSEAGPVLHSSTERRRIASRLNLVGFFIQMSKCHGRQHFPSIRTDRPFLIPEKNLYLTAGGLYCHFDLQLAAVKAG